ncbi:MAG: ATP-binding protein [Myxococcales bacterium]|nr:ATP-binding protein [Myxococcales bacterium]
MAAAPYAHAGEHLRDQLAIVQVGLRAAAARRLGQPLDEDPDALVATLEAASAARAAASPRAAVPLERLRGELALSPTEVRVLILLVGVEVDVELLSQARAIMGEAARSVPDVALIEEVVYGAADRARLPDELGLDGTLVKLGLVRVQPLRDAAYLLRQVRVAERVVELLHGKDAIDRPLARVAELFVPQPVDALVLPAAHGEVVGLLTAALAVCRRGGEHPVVLITGPDGAGRKTLLATAAAQAGMATLRVRAAALPRDPEALRALGPMLVREAVLWNALIVLDGVEPRDDGLELDAELFPWFPGPIAATAGRLTGPRPRFARGAVVLELGVPDEPAREALWRRALGSAPSLLARWAAERYAVTPGLITQAASAAQARAAARATGGRAGVLAPADLHEGLRGVLDAKLATLGTRIGWKQTWDDLVLPDDVLREIREFIARIKHRRKVLHEWGFARKVAKGLGLSALFSGPPGTGKTMVAALIASELALDLYQIDLAKVVSKWIGETEKNLGELFDAAEAGHAVLLFDEADALFAKRTQVQSSNDRHANLEVNYLLQRLESFAGVVVLTTNHETAIDEAFRRRLSLRVDFPVPEADERERLWRALLPAQAAQAADLDLAALATRFEMTGGYIKNAVVRAAFLAADEGAPITMRHLLRAARAEYQAMGKVIGH